MSGEMNKKLKELILENPDLELCIFANDDCNGEYPYQLTSISSVSVDSYTTSPFDDGMIILKSNGYDDFSEQMDDGVLTDEMSEEEIEAAYEALDWVKAIIIYVDAY